ncbi:YeiH family protein [Bacillus sp. FJAT-29814]|uniref:YeiH family protein n=1 Tax=Bacillus sp. FJAT-29814 TaxID=1729688 RepID=UPI000A40DE11|nr:YeiH family protein [Bacillus sp. FJAT-29814]
MSYGELKAVKPTHQVKSNTNAKQGKVKTLSRGVVLTLVLAIVANQIAALPFFSIMGIMIVSILLGMTWNRMMNIPTDYTPGIAFSSKTLLRAGIILMGIRLNLQQIISTGLSVILIDMIVIIFTIVLIVSLGRLAGVDRNLSALVGVGTAVCGAAAIVAVAPLIKAKQDQTAFAVAIVAILGTIGTIVYTILFPMIGLDAKLYGVLVGSTLHELAHVVAAAAPAGDVGSETAIVVKLGRVALLIPVALVMGFLYNKDDNQKQSRRLKDLPVPWFIFGFLGFSLLNTFIKLPQGVVHGIESTSVLLMSMAMAGLGLGINFSQLKRTGVKPVYIGIIGFAALAALGPFLLYLL